MKYTANITIMPLKELLDPQGKAVEMGIKNLQVDAIENVRIGKHVQLTVEANDEQAANEKVEVACTKLLANPVMEYFEYSLSEA